MKAFLVRIGVDQAYGGWNAPVDPTTGDYVYIPIPESATDFYPNCRHSLAEFMPALDRFCINHKISVSGVLKCNPNTINNPVHLDPDYEHLTYGDDGARRGAGIASLIEDDLLVFYSGLRPIRLCEHKLIYALVGLYVVQEVIKIADIPSDQRHENAHNDLLKAWGGLSVKDGFIQRSAVPPEFCDPELFYKWFKQQQPELFRGNY